MSAKSNIENEAFAEKNGLAGIDLLRFLLAVVILIYHFPHFDNIHFSNLDGVNLKDLLSGQKDEVLLLNLPFKNSLSIVYQYGDFAVRIFWMISGVIFFLVYLDHIKTNALSFSKFIYLRFSRLYPLHILTLVLIAVLQYIYFQKFGDYFIYKNNDTVHFMLNIFMINYWNAQFGYSFNGPFWSVSVEIFVYIVFYFFAKTTNPNIKYTLWLTAISFAFYYLGILSPFNECLLYFFAGCFIAENIRGFKRKQIFVLTFILMLFLLLKYIPSLSGLADTGTVNSYLLLHVSGCVVGTFIYLFRNSRERRAKSLRIIGNITYAVYMIHIPLQIILILLFYTNGRSFYMNNIFFSSYLLINITAGYLLFRYVENPSKKYLRSSGKF